MMVLQQDWIILDESGSSALNFTSFIGMDYRGKAQALTCPVEQGGFVDYNKVSSPGAIQITLGLQGLEPDFQAALNMLDSYQREAVKLSISTPARFYQNYTLESYSYKRERDKGAGMLIVEMSLTEVRETSSPLGGTAGITKPKNPASAVIRNLGKLQALVTSQSINAMIQSGARQIVRHLENEYSSGHY